MPAPPGPTYTNAHEVREDGIVSFACSTDTEQWPWLALPPQHPIVIQTQNFWSSVGASSALGTLEEGKWSALTWTDWELGDRNAGLATNGTFKRTQVGDELAFETRLFDTQDREIVRMRGKGVVFRTRNFEEWRAEKKRKAVAPEAPEEFVYAPRDRLGLSEREPPLISPIDNGTDARALITAENGLMPGHPFFSGSGDHVNAPHLAEVGRQVASLLTDGTPILIAHGEMDMHRYVELGCPFEIELTEHGAASATMEIEQLGRSCATLSLRWEPQ